MSWTVWETSILRLIINNQDISEYRDSPFLQREDFIYWPRRQSETDDRLSLCSKVKNIIKSSGIWNGMVLLKELKEQFDRKLLLEFEKYFSKISYLNKTAWNELLMKLSLDMISASSSNPSGSWLPFSDAQVVGCCKTFPRDWKRPTVKLTRCTLRATFGRAYTVPSGLLFALVY